MLNSRQRAMLRGMANSFEPIVHIGKEGIKDDLIKQVADALEARELIKVRVLETAPLTVREAANTVSEIVSSDVVQVIVSVFIIYKESENNKTIKRVR